MRGSIRGSNLDTLKKWRLALEKGKMAFQDCDKELFERARKKYTTAKNAH